MRKRAIDNIKRMSLTGNELENIFFPEKRIVCKTCHKIRIKSRISKYDFNEGHQNNICFCQKTQNRLPRRNHHFEEDGDQQSEHNEKQKEEHNEKQKEEQDEGGVQYVTKREFNEFKQQINQKFEEVQGSFKASFEEISRQIQGLKK